MVSGKKIVPVVVVIVVSAASASVYTVLSREKGASEAFVHQMETEPRCNFLTANDLGVRRQSLLALLKLHPEWGFDLHEVSEVAGRIDVAGAGRLPPAADGAHMGWVELGWPLDDSDDPPMGGARVFCREGLAVNAVPFAASQGGERLRSQGTIMLPPVMRVYPAKAESIDLKGEGADALAWRSRCYPDGQGRSRCDIDGYNPAVAAGFVPALSFLSLEADPPEAPVSLYERRLVSGVVTQGQVSLIIDVEATQARLSGDCPADHAYVGPEAADVQGCEVEVDAVAVRCGCGPWPSDLVQSSGLVACRPEGSGGAAAMPSALCQTIPLPPHLGEP